MTARPEQCPWIGTAPDGTVLPDTTSKTTWGARRKVLQRLGIAADWRFEWARAWNMGYKVRRVEQAQREGGK